MKIIIPFLLAFIYSASSAKVVKEKLFIVSGEIVMVNDSAMPYLSFNKTRTFTQQNHVIHLDKGDSLSLWVVNLDTVNHRFLVSGIKKGEISILESDSMHFGYLFSESGAYNYLDPGTSPNYSYLGLSGMIVVHNDKHKSFYWNIREHDASWNKVLRSGGSVDWKEYYPRYFTINGRSNPNIDSDTTARIVGGVGDTLLLYMVNSGQGIHSMHFHGFHATLVYSSKFPNHAGRLKDTYPIFPKETLVLRIVPDKPGIYPVHDHNLVAASANNRYPNGMFTTIKIVE